MPAGDRMLEIVIRTFAQHGYESTQMRDLAKACGVSGPTLYRAYGSKEGAFLAAIDGIYRRRIEGQVGAAGAPATVLERVERMSLAVARLREEHPEEFRVLFNAMTDLANPGIREAVGRYYGTLTEKNRVRVRMAQEDGRISGDLRDPRATWFLWWVAAIGMLAGLAELIGSDDLKDPRHLAWMARRVYAPWVTPRGRERDAGETHGKDVVVRLPSDAGKDRERK